MGWPLFAGFLVGASQPAFGCLLSLCSRLRRLPVLRGFFWLKLFQRWMKSFSG